jgi:arylsulfatase A-like enzyme
VPSLHSARDAAARGLFRASVWLAITLVAIKATFLGLPGAGARSHGQAYLSALAAITYLDVVFVVASWLIARLLLGSVGRWRPAAHAIVVVFVALSALSCLYLVANVVMLDSFGGFLTYQLFSLVGSVRMLRSSMSAYITLPVVLGLVCVPLTYVVLVWISGRFHGPSDGHDIRRQDRGDRREKTRRILGVLGGDTSRFVTPAIAAALALTWIVLGSHAYSTGWATRQDRAIAENPPWVFASSWWRSIHSGGGMTMADSFDPADLTDFEPRARALPAAAVRRVAMTIRQTTQRPLNVIVIVLESVGARWTSLNGPYRTTPTLAAESAHGLVFDNFYAHIGRSSNSLVAMLLSAYPKLDFRDITDQYPNLPGTSLASVFEDRGYHTAFITPSDLSWAGWTHFLQGRGFRDLRDYHQLSCGTPVSSWGVEDRCMVDGIIDFVNREQAGPFFVMGWTQQTHHPYEPTPGIPLVDLVREHGPDDYDLNRYLNVLRETDRQIGRLFEAIRRAALDDHTMVVVVGDHGQGFGYPHEGNYMQGRTIYEEDVHVPLLFWYPRLKAAGTRSAAIGGHVDLAPTIAKLAGLDEAGDWQGRSLIDSDHVPRAYFYVAEDRFKLGVREHQWKYIYDLREAAEELYDLDRDPTEQHNLAASEPQLSARLRQRLAAWTEANRRQYQLH